MDALTLAKRYAILERTKDNIQLALVVGHFRFPMRAFQGNGSAYRAEAEQQRLGEALAEILEAERGS